LTDLRIQILFFEGCPNHEQALRSVERCADELGVQSAIELVEVPDAEAATRLRFLGSPTVRVNGCDVEPGAEDRSAFVLACRLYRSEAGIAGQPDEHWIRRALSEGASRRQESIGHPTGQWW
jgi:hypothetical protein